MLGIVVDGLQGHNKLQARGIMVICRLAQPPGDCRILHGLLSVVCI